MISLFQNRWGMRLTIFAILLLILFGLQWRARHSQAPTASSTPIMAPSSAQIHATWQTNVQKILTDYDQNQSAIVARDGLLALTVARDDQPVHLQLVLAFNGLVEQVPDASVKLQTARDQFVTTAP